MFGSSCLYVCSVVEMEREKTNSLYLILATEGGIQSVAATCSKGFEMYFLKVPFACLGSMAAVQGPDYDAKFWSFEKSFEKHFENFLNKTITKIFKGLFKGAKFCIIIGTQSQVFQSQTILQTIRSLKKFITEKPD